MSGLYNAVLGDGHEYERGGFILALLGMGGSDVGRFRDAWVEQDPDREGEVRIAIYTRNGGGNRPDYETETERMRANPHFLLDRDDDFDSTYATYYFALPVDNPGYDSDEEWAQVRERVVEIAGPTIDTDQRWLSALNALEQSISTGKEQGQ